MKLLGYEMPLGMSVTGHKPEDIRGFAEAGFTHFEVGIPARMPDASGLSAGNRPQDPTLSDGAKIACRGEEEKLVSVQQPLVDAIFAEKLRVWSVHLPFGLGWDVAHYDEEESANVCASLIRVMRLTAEWHPRVYVLHGCLEPVSPEQRPVRIARSIRSLRELDEYAKKQGARVALENLPRSCLANTSLETRAMMQAAGNIPICFDVNHLLGETHASFLQALAPYVVTTHLSDYDGIDERHWLPGKGIVPWKEVCVSLMEAGYRGPFLFELRSGENGPYQAREVLKHFVGALS
jgi:sugar phosphate isomerase/epimerase